MIPIRLAIVVSHPIQYHAPLFRMIAANPRFELKVFFTWGKRDSAFDKGFSKNVEWDIPLLEGYESSFLENTATDPGTHHFWGLRTPRLVAELLAWSPDAVMVNGYNYFSHLECIIKLSRLGVPILFRGDSHLRSKRSWSKQLLRKMFLTWLFRRISAALYCGSLNKEYFSAFGMPESKLFFVPHSVDNDRFIDRDGNHTAAACQWREHLCIPEDEFVFLFAGKFQNKKNPLDLIRAFKLADMKDSSLVFVGDGELKDKIDFAALELRGAVRVLPFQNQSVMPTVYRLGNAFVLPSVTDETWGLAVNEAMCCSLPVIASDKVGCSVDLVKSGENGYVFHAGDVAELSECMVKLRTSHKSTASRAIIESWGLEQSMNGIQKACNDVLRIGKDQGK